MGLWTVLLYEGGARRTSGDAGNIGGAVVGCERRHAEVPGTAHDREGEVVHGGEAADCVWRHGRCGRRGGVVGG